MSADGLAIAVAVLAAAALVVPVVVLTTLGGRRRGHDWPLAVLGGVLFPLAWVAWYVRDDTGPHWHRARCPVRPRRTASPGGIPRP